MKIKCKIIKQVFKCEAYQILGAVPLEDNSNIVLSKYNNFSMKDDTLTLSEGKEYTVEVEEEDGNYGKTYVVKSVPSMQIENLESVTDEMEYNILCEVTTESLAKEINKSCPNYVRLVLDGKQDEIDLKKIKGVKKVRHNLFCQIINEKFKYYYVLDKNRKYELTIKDCRYLCQLYPIMDEISKLLDKSPYYALICICKKSFNQVDNLLKQIRPDLLESDQRTEFMILSILRKNENEGSTYMNANEMAEYVNEIDSNLIKKLKSVSIQSESIYYEEETKNIGKMSTYLAEQNIADTLLEKIANPIDYKIDYTKYKGDGTDEQLQLLKLASEQNVVLLTGGSGTGKAQPNDTIIPTPHGNKLLGELKQGDLVYDRLGKPTKVLKVFPQGLKDCYTVTFKDGRSTQCNDEHLWSYYTSKNNLNTKTLREMIDSDIFCNKRNGIKKAKYAIPICNAVEKEEKMLPIDPYVLGSFLGNGCCLEKFLTISSNDMENILEISKILDLDYKKLHPNNHSWEFCKFEERIKTNDLFNSLELRECICQRSSNKKIPIDYIESSIKQRYSLLQGLFDSDGSIVYNDGRYNVSYSSGSIDLINNILEILYSLGYSANVHKDIRKDKNISYQINVLIPNSEKYKLFRIKRKRDLALKCIDFKKHRDYTKSKIINVKKENYQKEMTCIYVDNEEHLYLTNDYIVTHNTYTAKSLIHMLDDNNLSYTLVTPTGISAKRLSESTGRDAGTIHRKILPIISLYNKLHTDYLICDEFGMCGVELTNYLCQSLDGHTKLILICDDGQLVSIQAGNCLTDILNSKKIPTVKLTKVFRYGIGSLTTVATDIRNGKPYLSDNGKKIFENPNNNKDYEFVQINENPLQQVIEQYTKLLKKYSFKDILVLTAFNVGEFGTYAINNAIQQLINPPKPREESMSYNKDDKDKTKISFRVGDKVINTVNTYDIMTPEKIAYRSNLENLAKDDDGFYEDMEEPTSVDIMNGDIGYIRKIENNKLYIQFDESLVIFSRKDIYNLLLAYSIGIHKIQGSQSKAIITLYHKFHKRMLTRNLIYVGDTRSQEKLIEIAEPSTINEALKIVDTTNRETWLGGMLLKDNC